MKRAFWLSTGMMVGAASSVSVMRRVRRQVDRFTPSRLGANLLEASGQVGSEIRDALTVGREAMKEREAQLWAELDPARPMPPRSNRSIPGRRDRRASS